MASRVDGLGTKFGQSIVNGNAVLDDVNPQMPQIRSNIRQLSNLADVYIGYLRRKLRAAGVDSLIHTVRGIGYRFDG